MALHRRINITLPEETVRLIDRVAQKGDRSFLISEAVQKVTKKQCLMRKFVALDSYNAPEAGLVMLATQ